MEKKRRAREAKGQDHLRAAVPGIDQLFTRWVEADRNIGSMTAALLRLLDQYGDATVASAVQEVLTRGTHDPGAVAILCEQMRRKGQQPARSTSRSAGTCRTATIPHPLEAYDAKPKRRH